MGGIKQALGVNNHKKCGCQVSGDSEFWRCDTHKIQTTKSQGFSHKIKSVKIGAIITITHTVGVNC